MRLVVDENIPFAEAFFASSVSELIRLPGAAIQASTLQEADALLVRSVTQVDAALLAQSRVQFVGSATIGVDHVDQAALAARGIRFAHAPGCNADSVVDYVLACLLQLAEEQGWQLDQQRIGIVGVGQVGGRLARRLGQLGCRLLLNDPPRAAAEPQGNWASLETLLEEADLLCLHTPLVRDGLHPSWHLIGAAQLEKMRARVLINAGRGAVIDPVALAAYLTQPTPAEVLLDVFEGEPNLDRELIAQLKLATPHIAGYSLEGKGRGTEQLYQAWCQWQGQLPQHQLADFLPEVPWRQLVLSPHLTPQQAALQAASLVYQPALDHWRLQQALKQAQPTAAIYHQLRKQYPERREFSSLEVVSDNPAQRAWLSALGFRLG